MVQGTPQEACCDHLDKLHGSLLVPPGPGISGLPILLVLVPGTVPGFSQFYRVVSILLPGTNQVPGPPGTWYLVEDNQFQ